MWFVVFMMTSSNRKQFPRYWPFVRGIHRSPVNSPHKGQWHRALMFTLVGAWINGWVNNREAVYLRRHRAHYDVTVMYFDTEESCLGGRLNIKIPSYQYSNSHYKDKAVPRPSYLYTWNTHTWKDGLYIEMGPWFLWHRLWPSCRLRHASTALISRLSRQYDDVSQRGSQRTSRLNQNGSYHVDSILKCIFLFRDDGEYWALIGGIVQSTQGWF